MATTPNDVTVAEVVVLEVDAVDNAAFDSALATEGAASPTQSAREDGTSTLLSVLMGAAAGAAGVFALDRLDWFLWDRMPEEDRARTRAARPGGEPPAEVLVTRTAAAAGTRLSEDAHAAASMAVHYSIGIAPAMAYALLRDRLPGSGVVRGAGFGAALFVLQDEGLNTVSGLGGRPGDYPWQDHARGLLAHTLYGIVVDAALTALERGTARGRAATAAA